MIVWKKVIFIQFNQPYIHTTILFRFPEYANVCTFFAFVACRARK